MTPDHDKPLILQSDRSILLHTDSPQYSDARDELTSFAELVKSPEYVHTYRITPLSLWNASAIGITYKDVEDALTRYSRYPIPPLILSEIKNYMGRYGQLWLEESDDGKLLLKSLSVALIVEIMRLSKIKIHVLEQLDETTLNVDPGMRGHLKQALVKQGFPVEDRAGYKPGKPMDIVFRETTVNGIGFQMREYQMDAVANFWAGGSNLGGSGVISLPCGAGKTIVGMAAMCQLKQYTLILVTNTTALHQWRDELLDKTFLTPDDIGEYSGDLKEFKPVTITTYQILTYRKSKQDPFLHMPLFNRQDWGLIIYDEVHLLPAPVFRFTAEIQSRRRLGLTATLIREDGRESDVFSLIGPKKYDVPWKVLEEQGWIAQAICTEIRLKMPSDERMEYSLAAPRKKYVIAASNSKKTVFIPYILHHHGGENILIIGQYLKQLNEISRRLDAPLITGSTPNSKREELYDAFRQGTIKVLVVSKVANFAIDLPEASVAIQVSGTYGSRQEEAQRLGRILRPKQSGCSAHFYSLISQETLDQEYAMNRQLFLTEQGYRYEIMGEEAFLTS